jgi:hypothetical protein
MSWQGLSGGWETAAVSYQESFWLATSAAAPIIALAAMVALPDTADVTFATAREVSRLRQRTAPPDTSRSEIVKLVYRGLAVNFGSLINLLVQAGLLAVSLTALEVGVDVMPPWVAICLAVGGLLLLAWTLVVGRNLRRQLQRLERDSTPAGAS